MSREIAIIGGGAAGFFAAVNCAAAYPEHHVTIYEKSRKLLAKVRVSGGGRCNVTHACFDIQQLVKNYPRGEKQLINAFARFSATDTVQWFEERGVKLKTEEDGRMFPVTDNSETIVQCLMQEAEKYRVRIITNAEIISVLKTENENFELTFADSEIKTADKILIAAGGHPKSESLSWLSSSGHEIISPVPSLFTFNIPKNPIVELMGVSVASARVQIEGSKSQVTGPLLITHWGMSGPAILKMSSLAARDLAEKKYRFNLIVSWIPETNPEILQKDLLTYKNEFASKQVYPHCPFNLPKRLWTFLLKKISVPETSRWGDLSKEQLRKLTDVMTHDLYEVKDKTTFKEEFVTSGGIALKDVDFRTMESRLCKGMYFAGEVLDIDAYTGGFNFQSAWTTGFIAAMNMGK